MDQSDFPSRQSALSPPAREALSVIPFEYGVTLPGQIFPSGNAASL
jgi:hypothetical protein